MNRTEFIGTNLYYSQDFIDDRYKEINNLMEENKHLNLQLDQALKDYENAVSDYEQEHYKVVKAKEYIKENTFSVLDTEDKLYKDMIYKDELLEILGGINE